MEIESRVNFIPCLKWVKRGVAKSNPEKVTSIRDLIAKYNNLFQLGSVNKRRTGSNNK